MMRELVPLVLAGVAIVPDWATAFGRRVCLPPQAVAVVAAPVYYPVVIAPPCLPAFDVYPAVQAAPLAPPTVTPEPATPTPARPVPDPKTPAAPPRVNIEPATDVKPVEYVPPARPTPAVPTPVPAPVTPPSTGPKSPRPVPESGFTLPTLNRATPAAGGEKIPAPANPAPVAQPAPGTTTNKPNAPLRIDIPGMDPAAPGPSLTPARPTDALPPVGVPDPSRTAKYTPPAPDAGVEVFPAAGPAATGDTRAVDFTNLSGVAVRLTVQGQTIALPHRHSVSARVPARFKWMLDDGAERTETVPPTAPGAEVVIRRVGL